MYILQHLLLALGGITLFLLGLRFMSDNMERLAGEKMKNILHGCTKNKYLGVLTGAFATAVVQSSIATTFIVVGFVSNGIITFYQAAAVIMGANIGTTITAQLVSLSNVETFSITALGSLIAFIGFLISFIKKPKFSEIGGVLIGFGMLFLGLDIVSDTVGVFKNYEEFRKIFLVKNEGLLLLNGIIITAIVQSSSAVTSVMIILASNGLLCFENSMFLILGANIGTCMCVLFAGFGKTTEAKKTALFNLLFNVIGAIILFVPLTLFKGEVSTFFASFSNGIERQISTRYLICL